MIFFVISDIHGSSTSLEAALEIYKKGEFDKILICGDILYHGARNPLPVGYNPRKVIEILNSIKSDIIAVKGNCESEVDSMVLEFPVMADYSFVVTEYREMFITHGHKYSREHMPDLKRGSIFISGHTHIPEAEKKDDIFIFNPGSISLPKGGFNPTYGVITDETMEIIELDSGITIKSINM